MVIRSFAAVPSSVLTSVLAMLHPVHAHRFCSLTRPMEDESGGWGWEIFIPSLTEGGLTQGQLS